MLRAIEEWGPVAAVRVSPVLYPGVNALHILGVAVLVGSVLALDVRILGFGRKEGWREAVLDLSPVAVVGFSLAAATGLVLFAVRASQYIENTVLWIKWALIGLGLLNVLAFRHALRKAEGSNPTRPLRIGAFLSALLWVSALFAGRWIAFTGEA